MKTTYGKSLSIIAAAVMLPCVFVVKAGAADVTVSSGGPTLYFHDTDHTAHSYEWKWKSVGDSKSDYASIWLYDTIYGNDPIYIQNSSTDVKALVRYSYGEVDVSDDAIKIYHSSDKSNSLVVDSSGNINLANGAVSIDRSQKYVGIGTTTPLFPLDVVGDIRFGSATYPWQTNTGSTGFFLANSSGFLPFGIENNAPGWSLYITESGNIGLGTWFPAAKLDVRGNISAQDNITVVQGGITASWAGANAVGDGLTKLVVLDANNSASGKSSDVGFSIKNTKSDFQWNFRTSEGSEGFMATKEGTGGAEFELRNTTTSYHNVSLSLGNGATCTSTGQWVNASSRAYKENIRKLDTKAAIEAFHKLDPVTFNFRRDKSKEPMVGFIAEDVPDLVATKERKGLNALEIVALLTKVVKEQEKVVKRQEETLKTQEKQIAVLEAKQKEMQAMQKRIGTLETILSNVASNTVETEGQKVSLKMEK